MCDLFSENNQTETFCCLILLNSENSERKECIICYILHCNSKLNDIKITTLLSK